MVAAADGVTCKKWRGVSELDTHHCSACGVCVLGAQLWYGCGLWLWQECTVANGCSPVGVLNYPDCMAEFRTEGPCDFTAGCDLLLYLATREVAPECSPAKAKRLVAAGEHLFWDGCHLWYSMGDREREVPPCLHKNRLLETAQTSLGYPGGHCLYELLKLR